MAFMGIDDAYVLFELSDDEECESSDDDDIDWEDLFREGKPKKIDLGKRKKQADEFEREMDQELHITMDNLHASNRLLALPNAAMGTSDAEEKKYYDDIYFDSDEEGEGDDCIPGKKKRKSVKHPIISNDDLFYDPDMDQADQDWVDKQRQSYKPRGRVGQSKAKQKLATSDAVLNCPACMTTLCLDCQRHDTYKGQYRAMFVLSCKVDHNKVLRYPRTDKKRKPKASSSTAEGVPVVEGNEIYHPVQCITCNTEVAVQDKDEVYHFFNVLTSVA